MADDSREQRTIVGGLCVIGALLTFASLGMGQVWSGVWLNVGTGLVGSVVTYMLFDRLLGVRERSRDRRESLVRDLNRSESSIRKRALTEMADRGWLVEADLRMCNLSGLSVRDQDLTGANLSGANLFGADLSGSILTNALFRAADLRGAQLVGATLKGASFEAADLRGAFLRDANALNAVFLDANLEDVQASGADLRGAHFDRASCDRLNLDGALTEEATSDYLRNRGATLLPPEERPVAY